MESFRNLQPLDPGAAGIAERLDQIEGAQCWIKNREGRSRWVNRWFLLNSALERVDQVVGRSFAITLGHPSKNFENESFRRMVVNGIL